MIPVYRLPNACVAAVLMVVALALPAAASSAQAPRIAGLTLEGKQLTLASMRGKPVLINVWSSW